MLLRLLFPNSTTMIIKSMSRKSNSFKQLLDYLMRDNPDICFDRNLYASVYARKALLKEFQHNAAFLQNARGRNMLYHEMLALPQNDLSREEQQRVLRELTEAYIDLRAKDHLVFGVMHHDKEHLHMHLMISANTIEGTRRKRLSKAEFASIQKAVEVYKNEKYPQLGSVYYQNRKSPQKMKQSEQEIKHRREQPTLKEQIRDAMQEVFAKSYAQAQFVQQLEQIGMKLYIRGKTTGIIVNGKKYRLKTLGLEQNLNAMFKQFDHNKTAQRQREQKRETRKDQRKIRPDKKRRSDGRQRQSSWSTKRNAQYFAKEDEFER